MFKVLFVPSSSNNLPRDKTPTSALLVYVKTSVNTMNIIVDSFCPLQLTISYSCHHVPSLFHFHRDKRILYCGSVVYLCLYAGTFNMPTSNQWWLLEREAHINWSMMTLQGSCNRLELPLRTVACVVLDPQCSFFFLNAYLFRLSHAPNSEICAQNCFFSVLMLAHMLAFFPFVLGICSFSPVMIDVCLVSYNVLQVCDCFSVTLKKKTCIQISILLLL